MAWIDSFPGPLHEGHGKSSFIWIFFFPSLSMSDFSLQTMGLGLSETNNGIR